MSYSSSFMPSIAPGHSGAHVLSAKIKSECPVRTPVYKYSTKECRAIVAARCDFVQHSLQLIDLSFALFLAHDVHVCEMHVTIMCTTIKLPRMSHGGLFATAELLTDHRCPLPRMLIVPRQFFAPQRHLSGLPRTGQSKR